LVKEQSDVREIKQTPKNRLTTARREVTSRGREKTGKSKLRNGKKRKKHTGRTGRVRGAKKKSRAINIRRMSLKNCAQRMCTQKRRHEIRSTPKWNLEGGQNEKKLKR